jgi:predicted amidohydrolase
MARMLTIGAAQSGPISRQETRADVVERLLLLMREAARQECELIVFTECALTAFFPHWYIDNQSEIDSYFEREMPSAETQPLFDEARRLRIGFQLGYAELVEEDGQTRHYNSSILVDRDGQLIGQFRKIHLPGYAEQQPADPFQNLEKLYFDVGNLGFQAWNCFDGVVGMCICNDRRWPETYRVLGLQGTELILLGYNTPLHNPAYPETDRFVSFHNRLCLQSGAYQNGSWVVAVAKAGLEEGVDQLAETAIIAPSGEIVAQAEGCGDELVVHLCDLDATRTYKQGIFNFGRNRQLQHYSAITAQREARPPGG